MAIVTHLYWFGFGVTMAIGSGVTMAIVTHMYWFGFGVTMAIVTHSLVLVRVWCEHSDVALLLPQLALQQPVEGAACEQ